MSAILCVSIYTIRKLAMAKVQEICTLKIKLLLWANIFTDGTLDYLHKGSYRHPRTCYDHLLKVSCTVKSSNLVYLKL